LKTSLRVNPPRREADPVFTLQNGSIYEHLVYEYNVWSTITTSANIWPDLAREFPPGQIRDGQLC
jgi:hypothetical protein